MIKCILYTVSSDLHPLFSGWKIVHKIKQIVGLIATTYIVFETPILWHGKGLFAEDCGGIDVGILNNLRMFDLPIKDPTTTFCNK